MQLVEIVEAGKMPPVAATTENRIEIELADEHRMRISGGIDPEALARLIRCCRFDPISGQHAGLAGGRRHRHAQKLCSLALATDCDDHAPNVPLILAVDFASCVGLEAALNSQNRLDSRAATQRVLPVLFTGQISHFVTDSSERLVA